MVYYTVLAKELRTPLAVSFFFEGLDEELGVTDHAKNRI